MLPLLGTPSAELIAAAARWFGDDKGAGVAAEVHRAAVRDGSFQPEQLGLGPRAAAVWRAHADLALPEAVSVQREPTAHGELRKRATSGGAE